MRRYYNKEENKMYYEGCSLTRHTDAGLFSGIPTESQLEEWGYKLQSDTETYTSDPKIQRMNEILTELSQMDYLTSKYIDGEDMSEYGDWQEKRKALREEYRKLEDTLPK